MHRHRTLSTLYSRVSYVHVRTCSCYIYQSPKEFLLSVQTIRDSGGIISIETVTRDRDCVRLMGTLGPRQVRRFRLQETDSSQQCPTQSLYQHCIPIAARNTNNNLFYSDTGTVLKVVFSTLTAISTEPVISEEISVRILYCIYKKVIQGALHFYETNAVWSRDCLVHQKFMVFPMPPPPSPMTCIIGYVFLPNHYFDPLVAVHVLSHGSKHPTLPKLLHMYNFGSSK